MYKSLLAIFTCVCSLAFAQSDTLYSKKTDSVTVTSKKPFIQTLADKVVMNLENRPSVAGNNALEALKQAPGVVVDANENIQMGGKNGVQVLLDGRPAGVTGNDLAQLLKSIEADNVKEIELITNPSSRFDAAGNAGIINIKLKKSMIRGWNGNASASWQQSTHARQNASAALNYRNRKFNWFLNAGGNNGYQVTIADNDRTAGNKQFTQRMLEGDAFHSYNIRTGIDYQLSKQKTIGMLWMPSTRYTGMDNRGFTLVSGKGLTDTLIDTRSVSPFTTKRNQLNLNYAYNSDQQTLNIDLDQSWFNAGVDNVVENKFPQLSGNAVAQGIRNNTEVAIRIASVRADYSLKLGGGKLEAGAKWVQTATNNQLSVYNGTTAWVADTGKTNRFVFDEQITAAYANYAKQHKKWSWQLGLRAEHTSVYGVSTDLKGQQQRKPDTAYLNLFPTVFVKYQLAKDHAITFNYGRRIDRPGYQDQNPFIYVLDAFNSEVGNPYLFPQMSNGAELGYVYKEAASIKIRYAFTSNYIEQLTYQSGNNTILIPQNAGTRKTVNINISSPLPINKWWEGYFYAEPFWQQYATTLNGFGFSGQTKQQSWGFNGYLGNWFTLKNNWRAEISAWFNYQNATTIYRSQPLGSMNIGVQKSFMKKQASVKLVVNDVFNTQRWLQRVETDYLQMRTYRKWESRNLTLSFSYRFGNNKIREARNRETGAEDELNRIKSK